MMRAFKRQNGIWWVKSNLIHQYYRTDADPFSWLQFSLRWPR